MAANSMDICIIKTRATFKSSLVEETTFNMEALRTLSTLWLLMTAIKCQAITIFELCNTELINAMDLISNSYDHVILWHSSHFECTEDMFCSMFFHWNLNCKSSGKIFTVSSNSTTAFSI